jgi:hypothetical protein
MADLHARLNALITRARYIGAQLQTRGKDDAPLRRFRATAPDQVFYIIGAGASVNDLSEADCARIEAGTSASINMAALLPLEVDITSLELVADAHQSASIAASLKARKKPVLIWYQDRAKHHTPHWEALRQLFPVFAYKRASVSVRKRLETYRHIFRKIIRPRLFDGADLRVSFAVTGSLARLTLLGCALGYRRFCYVGIDLGSTPYFWQEAKGLRGAPQWQDNTGLYNPKPTVADFQASPRVVPSFYDFLRILKVESGQDLVFETLDPKGRSNLTRFLSDDLNAG